MGQLMVVGDVGGHLDEFVHALAEAGCDPTTGWVPESTTVVQVGDLVHRGPDSDGCVALADKFLANSGGQYVQLFGNHEGHELGGSVMVGYDDEVGAEAKAVLQRWWLSGAACMAVAVETASYGPILIVHGGLTVRHWQSIGSPTDPTIAAVRLNETVGLRPAEAFRAGLMLAESGREPGPAWPDAANELYESWLQHPDPPPFGQIHGHSSGFRWRDGIWRPGTPANVRAATATVDRQRRHTWTNIGGQWFIGVDPGHGTQPASAWSPLTLEGQRC